MFIYIFIPLLLSYLLKVKGQTIVNVVLVLLLTINVFRDYSVGYDYGRNYKVMYDQIDVNTYKVIPSDEGGATSNILSFDKESVEVGWSILQYIGKNLNLPFSFVNFCIALMLFIWLAYALKQSPIPILSLLLYVLLFRYYASFNIIRQSIAAVVFIAAIPYIIRRQFVSYLLCCLFAASFHLSSLLMILFYFIPKIKISFKFSIVIVIVVYVLSALSIDMKLFSWLYESGYMFDAYGKYLAIENDYNYNIVFLYIPSVLLFIPYILLSANRNVKRLDVYQLLYLFAIIIAILSVHYEVLFRFNEFFLNSFD